MKNPLNIDLDRKWKRILADLKHIGFEEFTDDRQQLEDLVPPALEIAHKYLPKILSGGKLIVLAGPKGAGKTQIAAWWTAMRLLVNLDDRVAYLPVTALVENIAMDLKYNGNMGSLSRWSRWTPYLVLAECQLLERDQFEIKKIIDMIHDRCRKNLCTVGICDCTLDTVEEQIAANILFKSKGQEILLLCNWPSYRS